MSGNINDTNPSTLGGGIPGFQPTLLGGGANQNSGSGMVGGGERAMNRFFIRNAAGKYNYLQPLGINYSNKSLTPFRQVFVAGDFFMASPYYSGTTTNALLPSINQVNSPILNANGGSTQSIQNGAAFSGNPHYVYDSSDYIKFKKISAVLKTYNDKSFGGSNNGSYSFLMRVRS